MPRGNIRLKSGVSVHYDDVRQEGDIVVFKHSYSLDVQAVSASDVESITEREWHQTPLGSCKSLSDGEVRRAVERNKNR